MRYRHVAISTLTVLAIATLLTLSLSGYLTCVDVWAYGLTGYVATGLSAAIMWFCVGLNVCDLWSMWLYRQSLVPTGNERFLTLFGSDQGKRKKRIVGTFYSKER